MSQVSQCLLIGRPVGLTVSQHRRARYGLGLPTPVRSRYRPDGSQRAAMYERILFVGSPLVSQVRLLRLALVIILTAAACRVTRQ